MKPIVTAISLGFLFVLLFSCDNTPTEIIEPIKIPVTLNQTMKVNVTTTDEMTESVLLDAASNTALKDYLNGIQGYEITELKFAIENYTAEFENDYYFNGEFGFSRKNDSEASIACLISDLPVNNWAGTGEFEIAGCNQVLNDISGMLTSDNALKIYLKGSFSGKPLTFDLNTKLNVIVTASPLQ